MNPIGILIAYQTFVWKELVRTFRIWPQTLVPPAVTMALYFLIFGRLVGAQIHPIQGYTYMQFIVPGLIMMSVITNSYVHSSSSFFGMKFQKSIEELLVSPMPDMAILIGFITGAVLRAIIVAAIVMGIASFFTDISVHHIGLIIYIVLVTAIFFATAGVINGVFARTFDDVSWVPSFVITPLTYLGGVFFSVHMLSGFWQQLAYLDPILYIVDVFRYAMLGVRDTNISVSVFGLSLLCFFFCWYALHLLRTSSRLRS